MGNPFFGTYVLIAIGVFALAILWGIIGLFTELRWKFLRGSLLAVFLFIPSNAVFIAPLYVYSEIELFFKKDSVIQKGKSILWTPIEEWKDPDDIQKNDNSYFYMFIFLALWNFGVTAISFYLFIKRNSENTQQGNGAR